MSFKQTNPGNLSAGRGLEMIAFGFRINGTSNPDALWQGDSNAVVSVVRTSVGKFTVQLNKNWPREVVFSIPTVHQAAGSVALGATGFYARVNRDSYDATTGQFVIECLKVSDTVAPALADPADNDLVEVLMVVQTRNGLVTTHGS